MHGKLQTELTTTIATSEEGVILDHQLNSPFSIHQNQTQLIIWGGIQLRRLAKINLIPELPQSVHQNVCKSND